jgi:ABC-type nitrate/sulfonate/bicarbonate transport system substrate-binding protein
MNQVVTSAWVDAHGGDSKKLRFVELPMTAAPAALQEHRVDAAVVIYPPLAAALKTGKVRALGDAYGAVAPRFLMSGWFSTKDWTAKHADVVKAFNRIVVESAQYVNTHHAETAPIVAEFDGIPLDVIEHMTRGIAATSLSTSLIQPMIDASVKYGVIPHGFPADELIDPIVASR